MKMKKKLTGFPFRLLISTSLVIIGVSLIWLRWASLPANPKGTTTVFFSIDIGESIDSIGQRLKTKNLIRSKAAFKITVVTQGLVLEIQAGDFKLSPASELSQITKTLTHGTSDLRITLIEGWRREEMADEFKKRFEAAGTLFNKDAFLQATEGKEGYLFPDTYLIPKASKGQEIAEMLTKTFQRKVEADLHSASERQALRLDQAVIIASMIEREVRFDKDRPLVAGILVKRWHNDWPLQVDATIQYILGFQKHEASWWKKSLTQEDLKIDSPYNTYQRVGLPPAPICNPSLASIKAVADLQQSPYWFYLSDTSGSLHYAKTIEEHNLNIAKYLNK